ncbi:hypothetical protein S245_044325, partial [Arachis hypogaea]
MQKINQLLNHLSTVPETPTNSGESTSRIQTRSSKAINALDQDSNESSSDQSDDFGKSTLKVSPIMTNSMTKWKDGKTKYNIMSMLQHMTMVGTAYQAAHETSEEAIANVIVSGFSASHFIGDPSLWKDRSAELLSNLRCKTLSDFR